MKLKTRPTPMLKETLELSMFMMSYDQLTYSVNINQNNNTYLESVKIFFGEDASTMNILEDDFTDADFIVRDYKGDEYNGARNTFRLYGTFNQLDIDSKGMFTVEEITVVE